MKGKPDWDKWLLKLKSMLEKYKFVLLVILIGVVLLLLPTGKGDGGAARADTESPPTTAGQAFDLDAMERKLGDALSQVDGAGKVTVVLTVRGGPKQVVAQDGKRSDQENTTSTVVVSKGSGVEDAVVLQQVYPQYQGALVVCPGGGDPAVRLKIVEAVSALTGLGSDKISVCRAK